MAYFSPIHTAQIVGLAMAAVSVALPAKLRDHSLPASLFTELDPNTAKPELSVTATPVDAGWRLDFETDNWIFSDLCGQSLSPKTVGHAHVYIGDTKIGTATMPSFYISNLPESDPQLVTVSLRGLDHRVLVHDGNVISAQVMLNPQP